MHLEYDFISFWRMVSVSEPDSLVAISGASSADLFLTGSSESGFPWQGHLLQAREEEPAKPRIVMFRENTWKSFDSQDLYDKMIM